MHAVGKDKSADKLDEDDEFLLAQIEGVAQVLAPFLSLHFTLITFQFILFLGICFLIAGGVLCCI